MIDTGALLDRDIYVYCETEAQAVELLTAMEKEGYQWNSGERIAWNYMWPGYYDFAAYHFRPNKRVTRYVTSRSYEDFLEDTFLSANYPDAERIHVSDVCDTELETASDEELFLLLGMEVTQ